MNTYAKKQVLTYKKKMHTYAEWKMTDNTCKDVLGCIYGAFEAESNRPAKDPVKK